MSEADLPEQFRIRQAKRERLLSEGHDPYPVVVPRTHTLAQIRADYPDLERDTQTGDTVGVAGRVVFARNSGKLCFATLQDGDGTQLQAMISLASTGQEALDAWKSDVDLGDIVFVRGEVISSRRGELSVLADSWQMASKALRPLPVAHKEMSEESRVRQRYVDLIVRPEARKVARQRIAVVRAVRSALERRGFLEVETPMLQTQAGGAAARPFVTHSNALDTDLYLRIAPELFLKRCVVGGLDKIFELNRNFRNEGADSTHSPEFAMLETYQAYGDYNDSALVTRELIQEVADEALGTRQVPCRMAHCTTLMANGNSFKCTSHCRNLWARRSPRGHPRSTCGALLTGWRSRSRGTVVTAMASWSKNSGSTRWATTCGHRRSCGIFRSRQRL